MQNKMMGLFIFRHLIFILQKGDILSETLIGDKISPFMFLPVYFEM